MGSRLSVSLALHLTAPSTSRAAPGLSLTHVLASPNASATCTWVQEDGVVEAVRAFHRHLPLDKLAAGERVEWHLSEPHVYNFAYEHLAGMGLGLRRPLKEYRKTGGAAGGAGWARSRKEKGQAFARVGNLLVPLGVATARPRTGHWHFQLVLLHPCRQGVVGGGGHGQGGGRVL